MNILTEKLLTGVILDKTIWYTQDCHQTKSLIQEQVQTSIKNNVLSSDPNNGNDGPSKQQTNKTFPTMLKLIRGALIGGVNYEEIYMDSDLAIETNPPITPNNPTEHLQIHTKYQPSMKQLEKLPNSRNEN